MRDAAEHFRAAIEAAGLVAPDEIIGDGELHRFSTNGKRHDDAGWYVLHLDGIPAGVFGDWRTVPEQRWCSRSDADMTAAERRAVQQHIEHAKRARAADKRVRQAAAAKTAGEIWQSAVPAIAHPYLKAKNVRAHGVRVDGDNLIIPVRDASGDVSSLQMISPLGEKRFLPGGRVRACYHSIGRPGGSIAIAEGYATAATIHEETRGAVAVAFNAGNLEPVARALRAKYPKLGIVIAADDDWRTDGNPGLTAARHAAYVVGGTVAVPNFAGLPRGDRDTDFNDLARLSGESEPDARQAAAGAVR